MSEPFNRTYAVFDAEHPGLFENYQSGNLNWLRDFLASQLGCDINLEDFELPSSKWRLVHVGEGSPSPAPKLIFSVKLSSDDVRTASLHRMALDTTEPVFANAPITVADHWCPTRPDQLLFGTRRDARKLIGADALRDAGLSGKGVNVVIIDQGLNKQWIDDHFGTGRYVDGFQFTPAPGHPRTAQPGLTAVADAQHGLMIARNVLDIAPEASLYDLPLIPPRIDDLPTFLSEAHAAYHSMLQKIRDEFQKTHGENWVLVNAWAVFDRRSESPPRGYTENDYTGPFKLHPFTKDVSSTIDNNIDVLFCAGNCGQFCPDGRCSPNDNGPGRSIWGANSYYRVLTVGAVRTDGMWIGYSSQGPGPPYLGSKPESGQINQKPDFCVPSGFVEDHDAHVINRGTSAATGVAAGVVAALRSKWDATIVSPDRLRSVLNETAQRPSAASWDARLGNGIIDIPKALQELAEITSPA